MSDCTCVGGRWCEVHSPTAADCPCSYFDRPIVEKFVWVIGNVYDDMRGPVPGCPIHDRGIE